MKSTIILRGTSSLAVLGGIVCVFLLSACGNVAEDKGDKGPQANTAAGNQPGAVAATSPGSTVSNAATADKATQPGSTQTRNKDNARVSSGPRPQIGTGGSDFFLFTQARAALGADAELKTANVVIDVKGGVLTLTGRIANAEQKSKAEQLVRTISGVKEVKNQLRISN